MSTRRQDFGVTFTVNVGTTKSLQLTILDPDTGLAKDLSSNTVYAGSTVKIYKPDGTQVGATINATFSNRSNGIMLFTVSGTSQATLANAGNWIGEIAFTNNGGLTVDQQQFNIDIKQSF
jgi:hypothetical protein|tara:strand:+ start:261 stop:620 length:360 start_codon:yes stop_codon:yes gene_type:complete